MYTFHMVQASSFEMCEIREVLMVKDVEMKKALLMHLVALDSKCNLKVFYHMAISPHMEKCTQFGTLYC